jgi:hypothetical protein
MKVNGIFKLKDGSKIVGGDSLWDDNITHKVDDILVCGDKRWQVVAVEHIHQGCFVVPITRWHALKLQPIGHDDLPNINDVLVKP